jgi:hypothetical protein
LLPLLPVRLHQQPLCWLADVLGCFLPILYRCSAFAGEQCPEQGNIPKYNEEQLNMVAVKEGYKLTSGGSMTTTGWVTLFCEEFSKLASDGPGKELSTHTCGST